MTDLLPLFSSPFVWAAAALLLAWPLLRRWRRRQLVADLSFSTELGGAAACFAAEADFLERDVCLANDRLLAAGGHEPRFEPVISYDEGQSRPMLAPPPPDFDEEPFAAASDEEEWTLT